jgi:hypothetical protein
MTCGRIGNGKMSGRTTNPLGIGLDGGVEVPGFVPAAAVARAERRCE